MEDLIQLFYQLTGENPVSVAELPIAGSNRKYLRLHSSNTTYIGVLGTIIAENRAFIAIARQLHTQGIPVPKVLAVSADEMCYLVEDLGDIALFDSIKTGRETGVFDETQVQLLKQTIAYLPSIQFNGAKNFDFSHCFPQPSFDKRTVLWDLNYFKYCFLKPSAVEFNEENLENEFEKLAEVLLAEPSETFMYRDFQSRNVMLRNGKPSFIDFQGGRKGPLYYDVASFVYQAKANFPSAVREELIATYLTALQPFVCVDVVHFRKQLNLFVLFRNLQVLGAYGFRGLIERKKHFIDSIPFAIQNLRTLLANTHFEIEFPYLVFVLQHLVAVYTKVPIQPTASNLLVKVASFSYKKGIPTDDSGNGGGYVFDCRAIHNPGKYEQYKQLTGLDKPVIDFLEQDGEILAFLEHIYALADSSVSRYVERGFSSIMFSFGCTGGQHRSVYAAQHVAEYIATRYSVKVELVHREQGIKQQFN
ncbi:MAG: phosphotransferase [Paludibacteraceae bacterium]|nr:phosphotransferase [Paludibacteraceae bacterium]